MFVYKNLLLTLIVTTWNSLAKGDPVVPYTLAEPSEPSAAGRGGAFATSTDTVLFSLNPATLGAEAEKNSGWVTGGQFPHFIIGVNPLSKKLIQESINPKDNNNDSVANEILGKSGDSKEIFGRATAMPNLTLKRFRLTFFTNTMAFGYLSPTQTEQFTQVDGNLVGYSEKTDLFFRSDNGVAGSLSIPFKDTGFSIGTTVKYVHRISYYGELPTGDQVNKESTKEIKEDINRTRGVPVDVGIYKSLQKHRNIQFGVIAKDVGNTVYRGTKTGGKHQEVDHMTWGVGSAWHSSLRDTFVASTFMEVQNLNQKEYSPQEKVRIGLQLKLQDSDMKPAIALSGGFNGFGPTAGFNMDLIFLRVFGSMHKGRQNYVNHSSKTSTYRYLVGIDVDLLR